MVWQIALLVLFFVSTILIGVYCRRKTASVGDFILGGRSVGPWLSAFAYGTSYFSAVVFVGYAGRFGWDFGVSALWVGIGNALIGSLFAWMLLGRRTRVMTNHLKASTMPDFFKKRYGSRGLGTFSAIIIFIFLIPYSASVYMGLSGLFSTFFGIDYKVCVLIMALITAIYVIIGGYTATALNDFIQGIVMIFGIVAVLVTVIGGKGGLMTAMNSLSQIENPAAPELAGSFTSIFGSEPLSLLSVIILTSVGSWGLPQMVHKFYAIKNEKAIKTGTVISTVFALIIAGGSYFMGGFGRLYYTVPADGKVVYDNIVPTMLQNAFGQISSTAVADILIGVLLVLVLAASMSTLSSLVLTSSSTVVIDLINPMFKNKLTSKTRVLLIRIFCAVFILISVVLGINPPAIISTLMSISWGALAGAFIGPFMYGLYMKRATPGSAWASMIIGIGIILANTVLGNFGITLFPNATMAAACSILVSFVTVPLFSLFTPKMKKEQVDEIFECYTEKVEVLQVDAINE